MDGYNKASDPTLFDERSLLACFVHVIPAKASAHIRISSIVSLIFIANSYLISHYLMEHMIPNAI